MRYLPSALLLAALALPLPEGTAEGMARKCTVTPGGVSVLLGQPPVVVLDGVILEDQSTVNLETLGIASMEIFCIEVQEEGRTVGRQAIAIFTRDGTVGAMRTYLDALVEAQEEHRIATGAYAQNLTVLRFFATRAPLPIEMVVAEGEWTATVRVDWQETSCQVSSAATRVDSPPIGVVCT